MSPCSPYRKLTAAITFAAVSVGAVSCGDRPMAGPETKQLSPAEATSAMDSVHIAIPDGYTLVAMTSVRPPLTGAPSYTGSFESPAPSTAQVRLDGSVPEFKPSSCERLLTGTKQSWAEYGLDCAMTDIRYAQTSRTEVPTLEAKFLTGTMPTGQARIFVYWAGT